MLSLNNSPRFGSDPEGFFQREGQIIGSEKLIPLQGISANGGKVVRDGVQFELNPYCGSIKHLATNISGLFSLMQKRLLDRNPDVSVCFDGLVEVSAEELNSLSPATRVLGCNPSYNAYEDRPINVDPILYRKRSSGGHIHIGTNDAQFMQQRRRAVPVFDIIVGNTCVLLDRDPGARERRENYGRAGEFRLPNHGLEYRTTSNFWLRNYALMDLVFGLANIAYDISFQSFNGDQTLWNGLAAKVNIEKIVKAIDTNDYNLALKNFKRIVPFLKKQLPAEGFPLTPKNIEAFLGFAQEMKDGRMEDYFSTDQIIPNWIANQQVPFNEYLTRA